MQLILMVGFIGSGKNAAAQHLVETQNFTAMAFADSLKDAVAAIFCWDRAMLEGKSEANRLWRETVDPWWAKRLAVPHLTPRWVLQHFGTECVRRHFNPDIWIHNVERRIHDMGPDARIVVTDARFPNEMVMARGHGGKVVRVQRGPEPDWYGIATAANQGSDHARFQMKTTYKDVHESEWAWIGQPVDHKIQNDATLADLHQAIEGVIRDDDLHERRGGRG